MKFRAPKKNISVAGYLLLIVFLHVNALLKAEDPIADTQTEAISYDKKIEQDKDGIQAPATPKMIYYGGQGFLTRGSLSKYEKEISTASTGKKEKFNWSDWWEEKPSESNADETDAVASASEPLTNSDGEATEETGTASQIINSKGNAADESGNLDADQPELALEEPVKSGDDWW